MAKLKHKVRGRRLVAALALLSALVLVAASCGGGGGGPVVGPGDPEIPIVPADDHGDTPADATDLALGSSVQGQIEESNDDDFFRVRVTEAGTLTVYTTGSLDTVGELQASDGSILQSDDDHEDDRNFRIEHDVGPGTYYVKVNSFLTDTGSYVVLARFAAEQLPPPPPADDHGDTRSDATGIALGSSVQGEIEEGSDDDYFKMQVTQAGTLTVYTTGSLDTVGELQASDGSILQSDDDSRDGLNFRIEHDVGPGTYYLRVSSYGTATGSYVVLSRFVAEGEEKPAPSLPPETTEISDLALVVSSTETIDLTAHFSDPEGGALTYMTSTSDPGVARLRESGDVLTVEAIAVGTATLMVTATNQHGLTATLTPMIIIVDARPPDTGDPPQTRDIPIVLTGSTPISTIELSDYFPDPAGGTPTYEVVSSDPTVVTVSESIGALTFSIGGAGTVTVSVTVHFSNGQVASRMFRVTANPSKTWGPKGSIPIQTLTRAGNAALFHLSQYFHSPPSGRLSFRARSNNTRLVTIHPPSPEGEVLPIFANPVNLGTTTITLFATDASGFTSTQTIPVTVVNTPPRRTSSYSATTTLNFIPDGPEPPDEISPFNLRNLDELFYDPDQKYYAPSSESSLTYSVVGVTDAGVVDVDLVSRNLLHVRWKMTGRRAGITIKATDPDGESVTDSLRYVVHNHAPELLNPIPRQRVEVCKSVTDGFSFVDADEDEIKYELWNGTRIGTIEEAGKEVAVIELSGTDFTIQSLGPSDYIKNFGIIAFNPHAYINGNRNKGEYCPPPTCGSHETSRFVEFVIIGDKECQKDEEEDNGGNGDNGGKGDNGDNGNGGDPGDGNGDGVFSAGVFAIAQYVNGLRPDGYNSRLIASVSHVSYSANLGEINRKCDELGSNAVCIVAPLLSNKCVASAVGDYVQSLSHLRGRGSVFYAIPEGTASAAEAVALEDCRADNQMRNCRIDVPGICYGG